MIRVDVWLPDPASVLATGAFGAGALIRLESASASGGPYSEITTIAVVATTLQYTYWDAAGTSATWYRWRVSNAANSVDSDYSTPFQGSNPAANVFPVSYATIEQALSAFETRPTKPARIARLGALLGTATQQLIEACGHRDYFRHPASGSATWILDGDGTNVIHVHEGLVALDLLELSFDGGKTFASVLATDYTLRGDSPFRAEPVPAGEPFFHIRFTGFGQYTSVPATVAAARLTGARGWPAVPVSLVEGTVEQARGLLSAESSYSGATAAGDDQWGHPAPNDRFWPQATWRFITDQASRFIACHVGSVGDRSYGWQYGEPS